jgi:adenine-specific DNA methylase
MKLIKDISEEKLRGGFYTPEPIASFILKWAFNGNKEMDVLEPSCGDGVFLEGIKKERFKYKTLTAIEIDREEARKSRRLSLDRLKVINEDFHKFSIETQKKFDLIIGNPPYIRYQFFNNEQKQRAGEIFNKAKLKYSKLTNAWVSFIVGSSLLLKDHGKIGFVVPAEILQVSYAQTLREFLSRFYNKISIISFKKLVFPDIQQEVVLLLCEKNNAQTHFIDHIEVQDAGALDRLNVDALKSPRKKIDFKSNKWTFYFLDQKEIDFLESIQREALVPKFGQYGKVEVGITTGSNSFFTVPLSTIHKYNLGKFAKPLVGRSVQVPSVVFTKNDWNHNRKNEARTHLLTFPRISDLNGDKGVREYLKLGETQQIHKGYKCGIRDEWQMVPSLRISEALFIRRNNLYPKLIINKAGAYTTDTMHRVSIKPSVNIKSFTASYYNSLSLAFSEICGRSHGGGVLELMPNEVEEIFLPYNAKNSSLLDQVDEMIRRKIKITEILKVTDKEILKLNYGFSCSDIQLMQNIWQKLLNRRISRGKSS